MTDVETGYKAFRGDIIRNMVIQSSGFGFEIEVTAKVAKLNCRIFEVPISYYGRTYNEGKKIGIRDGIFALFYIFYFNLFKSLKRSYRSLPDCYVKTNGAAFTGNQELGEHQPAVGRRCHSRHRQTRL
jgi:hypothetical protein